MKKVTKVTVGDGMTFWVEYEKGKEYVLDEDEVPRGTEMEVRAQNIYLLGLIKRVATKLHAVSEATISIFFHAANHSLPYTGPNYEKELQELDRVAATLGPPEVVEEGHELATNPDIVKWYDFEEIGEDDE